MIPFSMPRLPPVDTQASPRPLLWLPSPSTLSLKKYVHSPNQTAPRGWGPDPFLTRLTSAPGDVPCAHAHQSQNQEVGPHPTAPGTLLPSGTSRNSWGKRATDSAEAAEFGDGCGHREKERSGGFLSLWQSLSSLCAQRGELHGQDTDEERGEGWAKTHCFSEEPSGCHPTRLWEAAREKQVP